MGKITGKQVLQELYGTSFENLVKLSELASKHNVNWYQLFKWDDQTEDAFIEYLIKKYKLQPRRWWEREIRWVLLGYGPTFVEDAYKNAREKVKNDKQIQQLLREFKLFTKN